MDILCCYIPLGLHFPVYGTVCPGTHKISDQASNDVTQISAVREGRLQWIFFTF